jgi:hypothetical protein
MCAECGCNKNAVGGTPTPNGKPTGSPHGEYKGVGGTNKGAK